MFSKALIVCVVLIVSLTVNATITDRCLSCICKVESGCRPAKCKWDVYSNSCGYYQLKSGYWKDCGSPGRSFESCAADKSCSERCVRAYMQRYANRCTQGRTPTCQDYARVHNGGPNGCRSSSTINYGLKVAAC
jgi:hypothetical protein